ncbi:MAG TPA: hypothetical protein VIJ75_11575 [Hanamia sp.]
MTELAACACCGGGHKNPERVVDSYVIRKVLACFFCSKEMCTGYKKHDKLVAIAGRQARKL